MSSLSRFKVFNRTDRVVEGWYWALRSSDLRPGQVKPLNLMGKELAIYRGDDGKVVALDAYCPHMGAHLAEGKVEGNALRCFFHHWKFAEDGRLVNVPCMAKPPRAQLESWPVEERYGVVWLYTGRIPRHPVPYVPELEHEDVQTTLGNQFEKNCHPNVVLINAIDAQHFYSVHDLPNILDFETKALNESCMTFRNIRKVPLTHWIGRFASRFYKDSLTYTLSYWNGSTGTVTLGPDFLHFHIMFATRLGPNGVTQGQTILLTKKRKGVLGWLFNRLLLALTSVVGNYFAKGDTKVFQTIQFNFKTPVRADKAIIDFAQHVEQQKVTRWGYGELPETTPSQSQLPPELLQLRMLKHGLRN